MKNWTENEIFRFLPFNTKKLKFDSPILFFVYGFATIIPLFGLYGFERTRFSSFMITLTCSYWVLIINYNERILMVLIFLKQNFFFKKLKKSKTALKLDFQNIQKLLFNSPRCKKSNLLTNHTKFSFRTYEEILTEKYYFSLQMDMLRWSEK
jgi:hypothetical protein